MTTKQILASLEKMYAKRTALDKQITATEKKLVAEVKIATKPAKARGRKPAAKKPGRKPRKPKAS